MTTCLRHVERDERVEVRLARLIDDHDIEARRARIEGFRHHRDRHDPHRNRIDRQLHEPARFGEQCLAAAGMARGHEALRRIQPADQRLADRVIPLQALELLAPGRGVDQLLRHGPQPIADAIHLVLKRLRIEPIALNQRVVELSIDPRRLRCRRCGSPCRAAACGLPRDPPSVAPRFAAGAATRRARPPAASPCRDASCTRAQPRSPPHREIRRPRECANAAFILRRRIDRCRKRRRAV